MGPRGRPPTVPDSQLTSRFGTAGPAVAFTNQPRLVCNNDASLGLVYAYGGGDSFDIGAGRLRRREYHPRTAGHVRQHGGAGRAIGRPGRGLDDLALSPEQRTGGRGGRSRTDEARGIAVAGDGGQKQDGPRRQGAPAQALERSRISGD